MASLALPEQQVWSEVSPGRDTVYFWLNANSVIVTIATGVVSWVLLKRYVEDDVFYEEQAWKQLLE